MADRPELLDSSDAHVRENFELFSKSEEFLNMPYSCLKEVISRNDLNVAREEIVFETVLKWVKASPSERQDKLPDLLSEVRMTYLPYDYLTERVASEELVSCSDAAKDLLEEVKTYHLKPRDESKSVGFKTHPRYYNAKHVLYALCYKEPLGVCLYSYNFVSEEWSYVSSFHRAQNVLQITGTRDKIFIFLDMKLKTFDLEKLQWNLLEAEHEKIGGAAVVFHENMIYCFGSSYNHVADRLLCFDTQHNEWLTEKKMMCRRCYPAAASLAQYIVVTGGYSGDMNQNSAEKYNPSTDEWNAIAPMLTPRFSHGCVNVNDKLYVSGGFDRIHQLSTAEVYDPLENQWKFISPMKMPRQFLSLVSYNSKIYAMGGMTEGYETIRDTEIYDPESDEWKPGLSAPEGFLFAVSVPTNCNQNVH